MTVKFSVRNLFALPLVKRIVDSSNFVRNFHRIPTFCYEHEWQERSPTFSSGEPLFRRKFHAGAPLQNQESAKEEADKRIEYAIVPKTKSKLLASFLMKHYHQHEPITKALGVPHTELYGWFQRYLHHCLYASPCDVSVQALDSPAQRRVGVLASFIHDPRITKPEESNYISDKTHPAYTQMNEFFDDLVEGLDVVKEAGLQVDTPVKVLEHLYVSVHSEYRHRGISQKMLKLSESIASNTLNCRVGYVIATSEYSYLLFQRNGYKVVREIKYADYANSKGERLFAGKEKILEPHHSCRLMVKEIQCLYS